MYALLIEAMERSVALSAQIAATYAAAGAEVEIPSLSQAREEFDAALVADPHIPDEVSVALGLAS